MSMVSENISHAKWETAKFFFDLAERRMNELERAKFYEARDALKVIKDAAEKIMNDETQ